MSKSAHNLSNKHPIIGLVLTVLFIYCCVEVVGVVLALILRAVGVPVFRGLPECLGIVGGGIVAMLIYSFWFAPSFTGFFKHCDHKTGFRLAALILIYCAYLIIQTLIWGKFRGFFSGFALALAAGVSEEVIFRGAIISTAMRRWHEPSNVVPVLLVSAALFGCMHLPNVFAGASLGITVFQAVGAMCSGIILGAIYLRSASIFSCMAAHFLVDFVAFHDITQASLTGVMIATFGLPNVIDLVMCIGLAAIGLYLVRPAKRDGIKALWMRKWSLQQTPTEGALDAQVEPAADADGRR